jgi:poly [ADP-ribose] polymerase 10/14/15
MPKSSFIDHAVAVVLFILMVIMCLLTGSHGWPDGTSGSAVVNAFPPSWGPDVPGKPCNIVKLLPTDPEYMAVAQRAQATSAGTLHRVRKIERIENHNQWKLYTTAKENMIKDYASREEDLERLLWHGTDKSALANICAGGFNRSYCGKNETTYGKGVYFARDFSYSAKNLYSKPDVASGGAKHVLLCRVLTGSFTRGKKRMIEPPIRADDIRYDSLTNSVTNPRVWVVFKDVNAYPEYLVTFI